MSPMLMSGFETLIKVSIPISMLLNLGEQFYILPEQGNIGDRNEGNDR